MPLKSCRIFGLSFLVLISPLCLLASSSNLDFTNSVIVTPPKLERLERKAITVLREEIQKRTGIQLSTLTEWPKNQQPVIAVGQTGQVKILAGPYSDILEDGQILDKEGFRLSIRENAILVTGNDPRGVLYGIGKLLRTLRMKRGSILVPEALDITTCPRYPIRGHQLGYRPKTNAYDAWSPAQFDQYIRELALFGANSIEIIPPRTDDTLTSPHMKLPPIEMMIKQSEIIDSYGMDVWIWYPNMGKDYTHPESIREELQEREEIFKKLKRVDVVFVPGGDPGDLHPDILFTWLSKVANILNKYHPKAKIWVSPQAFRPTKEWFDAFYTNVNLR
ncbi:MAG: glycoside hydrolase family 20 zincin-like fold domain-containing protein [Sedimentisphaerales bacterium]